MAMIPVPPVNQDGVTKTQTPAIPVMYRANMRPVPASPRPIARGGYPIG